MSDITTSGLKKLNEKAFSAFWRFQTLDDTAMFTENGEPLRVLYPGRPNDIQGADFRDAVITAGNHLLKGNVEIHLRSGDWRNHHHHLDPRYNSVVLHVVMQHNARTGTITQDGSEIPVLALGKHVDPEVIPRDQNIEGIRCSGITGRADQDQITGILDHAGETRFYEKSRIFEEESKAAGPGETVYRGLMRALGYSGNKTPFLRLATLVPLKDLENPERSAGEDHVLYMRAILLGTAGFLETRFEKILAASEITGETVRSLRERWISTGKAVQMAPSEWQVCRIRPANSPVRRLVAMINILYHCRHEGLMLYLSAIRAAMIAENSHRIPEQALVEAAGVKHGTSLIGKSRAAAIAVNVLLPFFHGITPDARTIIREVYEKHPKLAENSLEKHMSMQLGMKKPEIKTAMQQQGLIHIYNRFCTQGKCNSCKLGKL